jgi:hypothetical protein
MSIAKLLREPSGFLFVVDGQRARWLSARRARRGDADR